MKGIVGLSKCSNLTVVNQEAPLGFKRGTPDQETNELTTQPWRRYPSECGYWQQCLLGLTFLNQNSHALTEVELQVWVIFTA